MADNVTSIKEFHFPDSFFDNLATENSCLALGAGFSYGVKNTTHTLQPPTLTFPIDYSTIPVSAAFIDITKSIFNVSTKKYQSAASNWSQRNFIAEGHRDSSFFRALFTVQPGQEELKQYLPILYPNWHAIFTLNFDNLFEEIVAVAGKERHYEEYAYPKPGIPLRKATTPIAHLHGRILAEGNIDLVFSYEGYIAMGGDGHTLYDPLHTAVRDGKQLLILGTSFDEEIIDAKFFAQLPQDTLVYHFNKEFDDIQFKEFVANNPNYHLITYNSLADVFKLFEENEHRIKNIAIDGTDTINRHFIKKAEEADQFSPQDFYLAKLHPGCQWYGIIKRYDMPRTIYNEIKTAAETSFNKPRFAKVAAVVSGGGGSGKSTLLRRLAIDLQSNRSFEVLWLLEGIIESFNEKGLKQIAADARRNYLVIIEDWYRLAKRNPEECESILLKTETIPNIRLLIGDREIAGKKYTTHLYTKSNIFSLTAVDNQSIIAGIQTALSGQFAFPELKSDAYNAPLYLLLFVIFSRMGHGSITLMSEDEVRNEAIRIVSSDFKAIADRYPGLAQALYSWAHLYKETMIYLPYETLLDAATEIALFNKTELLNLDDSAFIPGILRKYIAHIARQPLNGTSEPIAFVNFTHDALAGDLIAQASFPGQRLFDNATRFNFVNAICSYASDYVASSIISVIIYKYKDCLTNPQYWQILQMLTLKENKHLRYLNAASQLGGGHEQLSPFVKFALDNHLQPAALIKAYLRCAPEERAKQVFKVLLNQETLPTINPELFAGIIKYNTDDEEIKMLRENAARSLLRPDAFANLHEQLVSAVIDATKRHKDLLPLATTALQAVLLAENPLTVNASILYEALSFKMHSNKLTELQEGLICKILQRRAEGVFSLDLVLYSLKYCTSNSAILQLQAEGVLQLLQSEDWMAAPPAQLVIALNYISSAPDIIAAQCATANAVLLYANEEFATRGSTEVNDHLLYAAIRKTGNEQASERFMRYFMNYEPLSEFDPDAVNAKTITGACRRHDPLLISTILKRTKNSKETQAAMGRQLQATGFSECNKQLQLQCLKSCNNQQLKEQIVVSTFLPGWRGLSTMVLQEVLMVLAKSERHFKMAGSVISEIIQNWKNHKGRRQPNVILQFSALMRVPFHRNRGWQSSAQVILSHYEKFPRRLHVSIILSHVCQPDAVLNLCTYILQQWEEELLRHSIVQEDLAPSYGDHILLAMGHPDLQQRANALAPEIYRVIKANPVKNFNKNLVAVVYGIVEEDKKLPDWEELK